MDPFSFFFLSPNTRKKTNKEAQSLVPGSAGGHCAWLGACFQKKSFLFIAGFPSTAEGADVGAIFWIAPENSLLSILPFCPEAW